MRIDALGPSLVLGLITSAPLAAGYASGMDTGAQVDRRYVELSSVDSSVLDGLPGQRYPGLLPSVDKVQLISRHLSEAKVHADRDKVKVKIKSRGGPSSRRSQQTRDNDDTTVPRTFHHPRRVPILPQPNTIFEERHRRSFDVDDRTQVRGIHEDIVPGGQFITSQKILKRQFPGVGGIDGADGTEDFSETEVTDETDSIAEDTESGDDGPTSKNNAGGNAGGSESGGGGPIPQNNAGGNSQDSQSGGKGGPNPSDRVGGDSRHQPPSPSSERRNEVPPTFS